MHLRRSIVAAAVAGTALSCMAGTAEAAASKPPVVKPFKAYGPVKAKQKVTGTVRVTSYTSVKWKATNKTFNSKTGKGSIKVVFTAFTPTGNQKMIREYTVKASRSGQFAYPAPLKKLSVQVWQGKKHGARVPILGK
ncbi:hypothetical protein NE235_09975 [Actinoallomurus spadix]|uniref:Uncharacterized protein n=1 Tax=Actinoallomurus spadix TaxID=79912 RepID=A0ABN0WUD3_9ACTN|nr:hypothetical protein [Actinoallomurus spadix]MCO5986434.1 hypothetical protein [Actinoallomurus spadix]